MLSIKQRELNLRTYYYYYKGKIDGVEGKQLKSTYAPFQKDNGLKSDGIYGPATDNKLIECVKYMQQLLRNKGYNIATDGLVGDATINAIKDFQSKNKLAVDGIAGGATMNKLKSSTPTPTPSGYKCKYFKDSEFACKCCGQNKITDSIKREADEIREHFGRPMTITSGYRCEKHNREVGGVAGSYHTKGTAIDFVVSGISGPQAQAYCETLIAQGKGRYTYRITGNAVHFDRGNAR